MWSIAQYIRFVLYDHPVFGERHCTVRMPNFLPSSVSLPYVHIFSLTVFLHILNVSEFCRVRDQVFRVSKQKRCTISLLILYFYKHETEIAENSQMSTVFNSVVCKSCVWVSMYTCIMHVTIHIPTYIHTYIQHTQISEFAYLSSQNEQHLTPDTAENAVLSNSQWFMIKSEVVHTVICDFCCALKVHYWKRFWRPSDDCKDCKLTQWALITSTFSRSALRQGEDLWIWLFWKQRNLSNIRDNTYLQN